MAATSTSESAMRSESRLLHVLGQTTLRISELEEENQRLQDELRETIRTHALPKLAEKSPLRHDGDTEFENFAALRQAYDTLKEQNEKSERLVSQWAQKYTVAKTRVMEWHDYSQKLLMKIDGYKTRKTTSPRTSDVLKAPDPIQAMDDPTELPSATPPPSEHRERRRQTGLQTTSSQSTVCEPEPKTQAVPLLAYNDDDEEPIVVSERQIKRRRVGTKYPPRIKQEGASASIPFVIPSDGTYVPPTTNRLDSQLSNLDAVCNTENDMTELSDKSITLDKPGSRPRERNMSEDTPRQRRALQPISANVSATRKSVSRYQPKDKPRGPLRTLPLECLQLTDFRPNPFYHGPAMTFIVPVRPDRDRRCLPNCTREACCGNKYRRMIEIGGKHVSGKTDREALEEYLGPNYEEIMAAYTPEKSASLVQEAHALCFAQRTNAPTKHGVKPSSPPGYWRTDMPSTQEMEEYRAQADEQELRRIAERHHEATREGGRWLFRDET